MSNRLLLLLLTILLALQGCSRPTEPRLNGVRLSSDHASYAPGGTVVARLMNEGEHPVGFWWCDLTLERQDGETWTTIQPPPRLCTMMLSTLHPGHQVETPLPLDDALPSGVYRLRTPIYPEYEFPPATVASTPFGVERQ